MDNELVQNMEHKIFHFSRHRFSILKKMKKPPKIFSVGVLSNVRKEHLPNMLTIQMHYF